MAERNTPNNTTTHFKRNSAKQAPVPPMRRAAAPISPAHNPYPELATREAALSDEQKKPLTKREKAKPAEASFPAPLPSQKTGAANTYSRFSAASAKAPVSPMARHTVTESERKSPTGNIRPRRT